MPRLNESMTPTRPNPHLPPESTLLSFQCLMHLGYYGLFRQNQQVCVWGGGELSCICKTVEAHNCAARGGGEVKEGELGFLEGCKKPAIATLSTQGRVGGIPHPQRSVKGQL